MKRYLISLLIMSIHLACNESTNSQQATPNLPSLRQSAPAQPEDPFVIVGPVGKGKQNPRAFIEASGFPLNHITHQKGFATLQEADKKYRFYVAQYPDHVFLDAFKQVAGSYIIRHYDLLASDSEQTYELLGFYCTELTQKGTCFNPKLCYECLSKLNSIWPREKIDAMKQRVIPFFEEYQKAIDYRTQQIVEKARGIKDSDSTTFNHLESLRKRSDQEKREYITKIKRM